MSDIANRAEGAMMPSTRPPRPVPFQVPDLMKLPAGLASLMAQRRWVNWNYSWNGKKWDKPPVGSYTDRQNWLSHAEAAARKQHTGIGFVVLPGFNTAPF